MITKDLTSNYFSEELPLFYFFYCFCCTARDGMCVYIVVLMQTLEQGFQHRQILQLQCKASNLSHGPCINWNLFCQMYFNFSDMSNNFVHKDNSLTRHIILMFM